MAKSLMQQYAALLTACEILLMAKEMHDLFSNFCRVLLPPNLSTHCCKQTSIACDHSGRTVNGCNRFCSTELFERINRWIL